MGFISCLKLFLRTFQDNEPLWLCRCQRGCCRRRSRRYRCRNDSPIVPARANFRRARPDHLEWRRTGNNNQGNHFPFFYEFWWVLMGSDGFWWVLMGFDGFWWVLMSLDEVWWVLMGFDEVWWGFYGVFMGFDESWWVFGMKKWCSFVKHVCWAWFFTHL